MNAEELRAYKRIRKSNPVIGAKSAMQWAKGQTRQERLPWGSGAGNHAALAVFERDGFTVRVIVDYSDEPQDRVHETDENTGIRNPRFRWTGDSWDTRHVERYLALESDYTVRQLAEDWNGRPYGMSKSVAWDEALASLTKEAEGYLADDFTEYNVTVEVLFEGAELGTASVGGFEPDEFQFAEQVGDMAALDEGLLDEALYEARAAVKELDAKLHASGLLTA